MKGGIVLASVQRDSVEKRSGLGRLQRQFPAVFDLIVYLHSLGVESSRGQTCSLNGSIEVASMSFELVVVGRFKATASSH